VTTSISYLDDELLSSSSVDIGVEQRKDANKEHCRAFSEAVKQRPKKYFAEYGAKQVYLSILMTHPDYRRHGAGTMLTDWGVEHAKEKGWPVTVCASPMGRLLYAHLGFRVIATEEVRVDDEEEVLRTTIMVLKVKKSDTVGWWQTAVRWWTG
jgi:GNAT superfamily N-acetyltransferase